MNSTNCIFCKIIQGEIHANKIYEDDDLIAFKDLEPQGPFHALVVPKRHIESMNKVELDDVALLGKMQLVAAKLAQGEGMKGYRLVTNTNEQGGQTIFHLHLHVIGGRQMTWPPG